MGMTAGFWGNDSSNLGSDALATAWVTALGARIAELEREVAHLRHLSEKDPLTGLANRRGFEAQIDRELERMKRYGGGLAVIALDLDGFKGINDTYGHGAGDALLQRVAATIRDTLRASDFCARLGGDEFVVLLPETDSDGAVVVAERLCAAIRGITLVGRPHPVSEPAEAVQARSLRELRTAPGPHPSDTLEGADRGVVIRVSASVGVAAIAGEEAKGCSGASLVAAADRALYTAKRAGRDQVAKAA